MSAYYQVVTTLTTYFLDTCERGVAHWSISDIWTYQCEPTPLVLCAGFPHPGCGGVDMRRQTVKVREKIGPVDTVVPQVSNDFDFQRSRDVQPYQVRVFLDYSRSFDINRVRCVAVNGKHPALVDDAGKCRLGEIAEHALLLL